MYLTTTDDVVRARGTSLNLFLNVTVRILRKGLSFC